MIFRSEIVVPHKFNISHHDIMYSYGSCFSENMHEKLRHYGFISHANSHGIAYNPISILKSLTDVIQLKKYTTDDIYTYQEKLVSFHHHGSFNGYETDAMLDKINMYIESHHEHLSKATYLFVTLGTSWVYERNDDNTIVSNCHKIPNTFFTKRMLTAAEIKSAIQSMITEFRSLNKQAKIVFTLSPVKHLRDGVIENNYSKALLYVALQEVLHENQCSYFPSYELMMDDLRDYRFWKEDMMHPNELALTYIWEKFSASFFSSETMQIISEIEKIRALQKHRMLDNHPDAIANFEKIRNERIIAFKTNYPYIEL